MKLNEYLQVDTLVNNVDYKLKSKSLYFEPGIQLIYPKDNWGIEFNVGYYKEFLRQDYSGENNSLSFADLDMWDGLRIGLTFSYTLMKKEKSSKD